MRFHCDWSQRRCLSNTLTPPRPSDGRQVVLGGPTEGRRRRAEGWRLSSRQDRGGEKGRPRRGACGEQRLGLLAGVCLPVTSALDSDCSHVGLARYEPQLRDGRRNHELDSTLSSVHTSFASHPHFPLRPSPSPRTPRSLLHQPPTSPLLPVLLPFFFFFFSISHILHFMINTFQTFNLSFFGLGTCVMRNFTSPVIRLLWR